MSRATAERVADALLWEGYLLYPYRASALKNQLRWQFGVVSPRAAGADASDSWMMQTECLIESGGAPVLSVTVRHLHLQRREVERATDAPDGWEPAAELVHEGRLLTPWDEAVPCSWSLPPLLLRDPFGERTHTFEVPGGLDTELVTTASGDIIGRVARRREPITFTVGVECEHLGIVRKLTVRIENRTLADESREARSDVPCRSLISAHTVLSLTGGAFRSPLEQPPAPALPAACRNLRTWPVLVGDPALRDTVLSSPIILPDFPSVAPESPVDLCDATEIDEILTLRVLTLTDAEKREARATDARARTVLTTAEGLTAYGQDRLHGAIRSRSDLPATEPAGSAWEAWLNAPGSGEPVLAQGGIPLAVGAAVRLRPGAGADAIDMFLAGQTARVTGIFRDLEDRPHVAVTVDAGDAADLHAENGRFLYFRPEEIEVVDGVAATAGTEARTGRVLVAGIGNIFFGDDGFGSAVVDRLARRSLPDWVEVEDFGIRGVHLAHDLLDGGFESVILIDAVARGGTPGTLYVIDPDRSAAEPQADAHAMTPEAVLAYLERLGGSPARVLVVGCEPATIEPEMGLSEPVARALDEAVDLVTSLIACREA